MNPIAEGFFASTPNPRGTVLAGSVAFRAGPDGLAVARFGWANVHTGEATNARTASDQLLGWVLPVITGIQFVRVARGVQYIRPGLNITLMASGDYLARFRNGALEGDRVYASLVDGSPISGEADDAEATPWYVVNSVPPGGIAIISTYSRVTT